jgi:hypothetical protein
MRSWILMKQKGILWSNLGHWSTHGWLTAALASDTCDRQRWLADEGGKRRFSAQVLMRIRAKWWACDDEAYRLGLSSERTVTSLGSNGAARLGLDGGKGHFGGRSASKLGQGDSPRGPRPPKLQSWWMAAD